jgi:hypothetical protein
MLKKFSIINRFDQIGTALLAESFHDRLAVVYAGADDNTGSLLNEIGSDFPLAYLV